MKNPITLLISGIIIIAIGALFKIMKIEYANIAIVIGLLVEIVAAIIYFTNRKNKELVK